MTEPQSGPVERVAASDNTPTVITVQLGELAEAIKQDAVEGLLALDPKTAREGGYVSLLRIGPPEPRAPWFPEGKNIDGSNITHLQRVLSQTSEISVAPEADYRTLMERQEKIDITTDVREIRNIIESLLIAYVEKAGVQSAQMRTFNSSNELVKETKQDVEKLSFKIAGLVESFKFNVDRVKLTMNEIFPTYKSDVGAAKGADIETSYQANIAVKVGISFLISALHYNNDLRKTGAKDPANQFVKTLPGQMRRDDVRYYLSQSIIESAAMGVFLRNIGLFHSDMHATLQERLRGEAKTPEAIAAMKKKIAAKSLEIFDQHPLLNLPAAKALLKGFAAAKEELSSLNEDNRMLVEIARAGDAYYTLTSARPYRNRFNRSDAMEHMIANAGGLYNARALKIFFRSLQPFELGEIVYLAQSGKKDPLHVAKIAGFTDDNNNPLWKSMPVVKILSSIESAEDMNGLIINLAKRHGGDDRFKAGETIFFGSDATGPTFQAVVQNAEPLSVKFLKCISDEIAPDRAAKIVGQTIAIAGQKPSQRLWKIAPELRVTDTVRTERSLNIADCDY